MRIGDLCVYNFEYSGSQNTYLNLFRKIWWSFSGKTFSPLLEFQNHMTVHFFSSPPPPPPSILSIWAMTRRKISSTFWFSLAEVSRNAAFISAARFLPCSCVTRLSTWRSVLLPTRMMGTLKRRYGSFKNSIFKLWWRHSYFLMPTRSISFSWIFLQTSKLCIESME